VALAINGRGRNGTYEIGGPDLMTLEELVKLIMETSGRRRALVHVPAAILRAAGMVAEMLPGALFSRDAVNFLVADNVCDNAPLVAEFGLRLSPVREGLAYLARK
jgi:NADH dehydrogenase